MFVLSVIRRPITVIYLSSLCGANTNSIAGTHQTRSLGQAPRSFGLCHVAVGSTGRLVVLALALAADLARHAQSPEVLTAAHSFVPIPAPGSIVARLARLGQVRHAYRHEDLAHGG
jgi:hypothetical protein